MLNAHSIRLLFAFPLALVFFDIIPRFYQERREFQHALFTARRPVRSLASVHLHSNRSSAGPDISLRTPWLFLNLTKPCLHKQKLLHPAGHDTPKPNTCIFECSVLCITPYLRDAHLHRQKLRRRQIFPFFNQVCHSQNPFFRSSLLCSRSCDSVLAHWCALISPVAVNKCPHDSSPLATNSLLSISASHPGFVSSNCLSVFGIMQGDTPFRSRIQRAASQPVLTSISARVCAALPPLLLVFTYLTISSRVEACQPLPDSLSALSRCSSPATIRRFYSDLLSFYRSLFSQL